MWLIHQLWKWEKSLQVSKWQQVSWWSLIKNLKYFEDDAKIRLLNFLMYLQTARRYFYQDGFTQISTSEFLSNWNTMFWIISQEQHSTKTLEFTETNSYFHNFIYEKTCSAVQLTSG